MPRARAAAISSAPRGAVDAVGALLVRGALPDDRGQDDEGRLLSLGLGLGDELGDAGEVVHRSLEDLPAVGLVALGNVLGEGDVGGAVDGDLVGVVEGDELPEPQVSRQGGFGSDALLEAAVADQGVGVVVHDRALRRVEPGGEDALGDRHADGRRDALAEAGGEDADAGGPCRASRVAGAGGPTTWRKFLMSSRLTA